MVTMGTAAPIKILHHDYYFDIIALENFAPMSVISGPFDMTDCEDFVNHVWDIRAH